MKPCFNYKNEKRERKGINASDYGSLGINVILALKGEEVTNPDEWNDTLRMAAGKGVELQMIKILKENEVVEQDFDQEKEPTTEIERLGVPIRMRFDAVVKKGGATLKTNDLTLPETHEITLGEGEPIEIKSINNANSFDIAKYSDNKPRENYVGQLAIYMDALGKDTGHLFVSAINGLNFFWFVCKKIEEGKYQCGDTVVDLNKEYARFAEIWKAKDKPLAELTDYWDEEKYKIPLEEIDWTQLSVSKIGDVRNGRFVVGSENKWKIDYSQWKNLILKMQGVEAGYSDEELAIIRVKTAGFSSKKK